MTSLNIDINNEDLLQDFFVVVLLCMMSFSTIPSQTKILSHYNISENKFYEVLDNTQLFDFHEPKFIFNKYGNYSFLKEKSYFGDDSSIIFYIGGTTKPSNIILKNISFLNYKSIKFSLDTKCNLILEDCIFINIEKGISFEFGEKYSDLNDFSEIIISDCLIIDPNLYKGRKKNYYQLQFSTPTNIKRKIIVSNITISNCEFSMMDSSSSWKIKSVNEVYPKRHSLKFTRNNEKVAYNNVTIEENKFQLFAPYYRTEAVTFLNNPVGNFTNKRDLYFINHKIDILNNYMKTTSEDPGHGIFLQGPYKNVRIMGNVVENFGMNMLGKKAVYSDGAVDLYGARNAKYSDDIIDAIVADNIIKTMSNGIKIMGGRNIDLSWNTITILPWPLFYENHIFTKSTYRAGIRIATGAYKEKGKQSQNILVSNNSIECNLENGSMGINIQGIKNFNINNNKIQNSTSYGILVFGHGDELSLDLGTSYIENNIVRYGNVISSPNEEFYSRYGVKLGAIKLHRMDNGATYNNEKLTVRKNIIVDSSNTIEKYSITDLSNSNLKYEK